MVEDYADQFLLFVLGELQSRQGERCVGSACFLLHGIEESDNDQDLVRRHDLLRTRHTALATELSPKPFQSFAALVHQLLAQPEHVGDTQHAQTTDSEFLRKVQNFRVAFTEEFEGIGVGVPVGHRRTTAFSVRKVEHEGRAGRGKKILCTTRSTGGGRLGYGSWHSTGSAPCSCSDLLV